MIRRGLPLLLLSAVACARPEIPPGGPEDLMPPIVVETRPDTFAVIEAGEREVHFRFSERISERPTAGTLNDAVVVSPSTGNLRVRHGRDGITIQMQEGMLPGRLYRITVLPVINDMFGNRLRDPFDLVLSTGDEFVSNVVAGMVEDRVTGAAVPEVRVEARFPRDGDTVTHWNFSSPDGVFSLRYVPAGPFEVRAWQDRNRDGEVGESEPQTGFRAGQLPEPPDTSFSILSLIEPDTTPARLASVTAEDSVTLRFEFDDYLEPDLPGVLIGGTVIVAASGDTATDAAVGDTIAAVGDTIAPVGDTITAVGDTITEAGDTIAVAEPGDTLLIRIFQQHEYDRWLAERADSVAQAAAEAVGAGEAPQAEEPGDSANSPAAPVGLSGLRLPLQTLVGVLEEPLVAGVPYEATVSRVLNIAGTGGGGGAALVVLELPVPDTLAADSLGADSTGAVVPDTGQVVPDTTQVVPDTTQVADTSRVVPDTVLVPDTSRVRPDTSRVRLDTSRVRLDTHRPRAPRPRLTPRRPPIPSG